MSEIHVITGLKAEITQLKIYYKKIIAEANDTIKHLKTKAEFDMPPAMHGHYHNACTYSCDMIDGPCACGAWHSAKEWVEKLNKIILEYRNDGKGK